MGFVFIQLLAFWNILGKKNLSAMTVLFTKAKILSNTVHNKLAEATSFVGKKFNALIRCFIGLISLFVIQKPRHS